VVVAVLADEVVGSLLQAVQAKQDQIKLGKTVKTNQPMVAAVVVVVATVATVVLRILVT
jgi:hypothetical protein